MCTQYIKSDGCDLRSSPVAFARLDLARFTMDRRLREEETKNHFRLDLKRNGGGGETRTDQASYSEVLKNNLLLSSQIDPHMPGTCSKRYTAFRNSQRKQQVLYFI